MWKQGRVSKDWFADYLGLSARVRVHPETGKATEISWYISDKVETVSPVSATVDVAKRIAKKLIDHQIFPKRNGRKLSSDGNGDFFSEMRALLRYAVCVLVSFLAAAYAVSARPIALFTFCSEIPGSRSGSYSG
jgi:hypothetical protein